MEMFLMVLCMSLFGLGITCIAFRAADRPELTSEETEEERVPELNAQPARFFADTAAAPNAAVARVPVEAILLQIENHVRLEQAAAESFLEYPTAELLHSRTLSPLVN